MKKKKYKEVKIPKRGWKGLAERPPQVKTVEGKLKIPKAWKRRMVVKLGRKK